jgi:two-component system OmpR family sensor kinase
MKHRTFLATLILFLLFFNLGILMISLATFRDMIDRSKEKSLGEHYFMTSALVKDFDALILREVNIDDSLSELLQPYQYMTDEEKVRLTLYKNNEPIYMDLLETKLAASIADIAVPEDGDRLIWLKEKNEHTYIAVAGKLPHPYSSYTLLYLYDIREEVQSWKDMMNILFILGAFLSGVLALLLLLLLNRIFKPLSQITQTSRDIALGAYETRLSVSGHDELSEMAQSFNHMADEIQRQMNELIQEADNKQRFIDNFAHELRTPLTAIYGYAEYIQKASVSEEERLSAVNYIMSESRRMQAMAYQLLELANLKNDQLNLVKLDLPELFQLVLHTLHKKIAEKNLQVELDCKIDSIIGDTYLLESLLVNLADNAIKACDMGGHVILSAVKEGEAVTISIRDNGKGMSPEELKHATEPFFRGDKSRNRKDGGAGLGLAICSQIAACHNAKLEIISQLGKGTTVKINFTAS